MPEICDKIFFNRTEIGSVKTYFQSFYKLQKLKKICIRQHCDQVCFQHFQCFHCLSS